MCREVEQTEKPCGLEGCKVNSLGKLKCPWCNQHFHPVCVGVPYYFQVLIYYCLFEMKLVTRAGHLPEVPLVLLAAVATPPLLIVRRDGIASTRLSSKHR